MSRGNIRQARQYQPNRNNNNNNNQNNQNQIQQQQPQPQQQQSSNELVIPTEVRRALDELKKARSQRSDFIVLEPNTTYRLQFDPSKSHIEKKVFNGVATERISHSVIDLGDPDKIEKTLSLTFKQSKPIEDAMEKGYIVMDITKIGESFSLTYQVNPID
jgi:hypothetical protein